MSPVLPEAFSAALATEIGEDILSTDPDMLETYGRDWTRVIAPAPSAIARPRTTEQVAKLVKLCNAHGVAMVPSGGRTGLAGGAVAARGELVISFERMNRMDPVEPLGATVRVQAGAITEAVHRHCAEQGLTGPVDFASKGSSQVGGNISTNAGGVRVIRYGVTRPWVLGLQVVTATGEILELNGALEKNNTGLDLRQLFIGSEGTLGLVTEATLKLVRLPAAASVFLFAVPDVAAVLTLFREVRQAPLQISAYEFFTDRCLARVQQHRKLRSPFDSPSGCYVLLEVEGGTTDALETLLTSLFERGRVTDGTLAQNASQAAELWALRESISESLSATGFPHKNDVALPVVALEAFCAALDEVFRSRYPDWEVCLFGHIGDGNLHVNVMKPEGLGAAEFLRHTHAADQVLFELVRAFRGSVSAEHGIGLLKKDALAYSRSPQELALMRAVKQVLDPRGLLNPGKILD